MMVAEWGRREPPEASASDRTEQTKRNTAVVELILELAEKKTKLWVHYRG
jgi:hypothetical protein